MKRLRTMLRASDEGAILVIVLLFVLVIGLVSGAVISVVRESIATTPIVHSKQAKIYAADAGISQGIAAMRTDNTLCPTAGSSGGVYTGASQLSITDPERPSSPIPVNVTCTTTTGSALGANGYAVVTTDTTADSLTTAAGGNKTIEGPVFTSRMSTASDLEIDDGNLYEDSSSGKCTAGATSPVPVNLIKPSPPYGFHCVNQRYPDPSPTLPTSVPAAAPAKVTSGSCTTFFPGTYTTAAQFAMSSTNYMVSGVYYLNNLGAINLGSALVGGAPSTNESSVNGITPCDNDAAHAAQASGTGVKVILGGNTSISVGNNTDFELYSRRGGAASEGTQGLSIMSVESSTGGWNMTTQDPSSNILSVGNGAHANMAIHGLVYVPHRGLDIFATNASDGQVLGGVVVGRINIKASGSAGGLAVSVLNGTGERQVIVTATADPSQTSGKSITSTAVIDIDNSTNKDATIESWITSN